MCGVMRREGKGTGQMIEPHPQMQYIPAAADVPVATEKKIKQSAVSGEIQQPPL